MTLSKDHLTTEVPWAAYTVHQSLSPGDGELSPLLPAIQQEWCWANGQLLRDPACWPPVATTQHLHDFDLVANCSSTHDRISHSSQKTLPQNHSLCLFTPSNLIWMLTSRKKSVTFFHILTKRPLFQDLHFSSIHILKIKFMIKKNDQSFPTFYSWQHQVSCIIKTEIHDRLKT